jgi:nicotinate phosphoribosyltransferase
VTNDLDEYTLAALRAAPVDSYGVGTSVVTGSGAPASGMVYKLVAHQSDAGEWIAVGKLSDGKATVAGRKVPVRSLDHGVAVEETVYVEEPDSLPKPGRGLLVDLVTDGVVDPSHLGAGGVAAAREHHAAAIAELPFLAFGLSRGEPVIPTVYI